MKYTLKKIILVVLAFIMLISGGFIEPINTAKAASSFPSRISLQPYDYVPSVNYRIKSIGRVGGYGVFAGAYGVLNETERFTDGKNVLLCIEPWNRVGYYPASGGTNPQALRYTAHGSPKKLETNMSDFIQYVSYARGLHTWNDFKRGYLNKSDKDTAVLMQLSYWALLGQINILNKNSKTLKLLESFKKDLPKLKNKLSYDVKNHKWKEGTNVIRNTGKGGFSATINPNPTFTGTNGVTGKIALNGDLTINIPKSALQKGFSFNFYHPSISNSTLTRQEYRNNRDGQRLVVIDGAWDRWDYYRFDVQPQTHKLKIKKTSLIPNLVQSSGNYSLQGASFGIYKTKDNALKDTNRVKTATIDSSGYSKEIELDGGTYWGMELTAPKGHIKSSKPFEINLKNGDKTITVKNSTTKEISFDLFKKKNETDENLGNSIFKIEYRDSKDSSVNKTWYVKSKRNSGSIKIENDTLVSFNGNKSDDTYIESGNSVLPIGHYKIQEVQAPDGHILDSTVMEFEINQSGQYKNISVKNSHVNKQTYARVYKKDFGDNIIKGHDRNIMKFKVFENGVDITSKFGGSPQSGYKLNPQNGGALGLSELSTNKDTGFVDLMQLKLNVKYTIKETTPPFGFDIGKEGNEDVISVDKTNDKNNPKESILKNKPSTIMVEKRQMGNNKLVENNPMRFKVVGETGLFTGDITSKLKKDGNEYIFDPEYNDGTEEIETNDNGYVIIKGLEYNSKIKIVETTQPEGFFPDENPQDRVLTVGNAIEKEDGTLENNTVTVINEKIPSLKTVLGHANDEHGKNEDEIFEVYPVNKLDLKDKLIFDDVMKGYEYKITHRLMDKETNETIIEKIEMITPDTEHFETDFLQSVDGSKLRGKTIVAFVKVERLSSKLPDKTKVLHEDYSDKDQTIRVVNPSIRTRFTTFDRLKYAQGDYNQKLVDNVQYDDVIKGLPINLDLLLFDKTFNIKLKSDGNIQETSKTFTPKEKSGVEPIEIDTNLNMHKGKEIVAMTELSYKDEILTNHSDVKDKDQTIDVVAPDMPITGSTYTKTILLVATALIATITIAYKLRKRKELN